MATGSSEQPLYVKFDLDGGWWSENYCFLTGTSPSFRTFDVQNYSNPAYKMQIARRVDAGTPYATTGGLYKPHWGHTKCRYQHWSGSEVNGVGTYRRSLQGNYDWESLVPIEARDLALTRFRQKLNSSTGHKSLLPVIGEMGELRRTIMQTAQMGAYFLDVVRSARKGQLRNAARGISSAWLNFSFGVKPLLSDMSDIANSIASRLGPSGTPNRRLVGTAELPVNFSFVNPNLTTAVGWDVTDYASLKGTALVKVVGAYGQDWTSSNDYSYFSQFGIEFSKIIPAAYELTAFSWLADYFTTCGDFVSDVFSCDPHAIYLSESCRLQLKGPTYAVGVNTGVGTAFGCKPGYIDAFYYKRRPLEAIPSRSLRLKSLDEISSNSLNRLANLASLLGARR